MKANMEKKYKAVSAVWAVLGVLFLAGAFAVFLMRHDMPQIPGAELAHIGFLIVGILFLIISIAVYNMAKEKDAMIEEKDERSQIISGKAGNTAFFIQTVLIVSALFLLCFMGFTNVPVMISLLCIVAASVLVYVISVVYYKQKM